MAREHLLNIIASNLAKLDGAATYSGTYGYIPPKGLFTSQLTNRPSKSWPKAQILITSTYEQAHNLTECLIQWKEMCGQYRNQYLLIADEGGDDLLYDHAGHLLAQGEELETALEALVSRLKVTPQGNMSQPLTPVTRNVQVSNRDRRFMQAMRTKPFILLAGISGTGKSRIVKQMAFDSCPDKDDLRADKTSPGNYCLIEVKPNWHDSSELLGYERTLSEGYHVTPFLRFIAKAMRYPDVPFFLCLDEMNLAPVEQYFAEYLSVLESRTHDADGITSEPLLKPDIFSAHPSLAKELAGPATAHDMDRTGSLFADETTASRRDTLADDLAAHGLRLPPNVIVVGTVNMDETTRQFSRKVIDRAMTIEMNISDGREEFDRFFSQEKTLAYGTDPLPANMFKAPYVSAANAMADMTDSDKTYLADKVPEMLADLNSALDNTPFKIAFRVQNELILFFNALRQDSPDMSAQGLLDIALDEIMVMKVLPRVEGDIDLLGEPVKALADYAKRYSLSRSAAKIDEMTKRLDRGQFTSFWP